MNSMHIGSYACPGNLIQAKSREAPRRTNLHIWKYAKMNPDHLDRDCPVLLNGAAAASTTVVIATSSARVA